MQHPVYFLLVLLASLLTACSSGEDGGNGGTIQNPTSTNGPQLATIGNRNLLSGNPLIINLSATNPNGGSLSWFADGTVGPNNNPLMAGASFDENTGQFVWSDTSLSVGSYSIRFTVMDDAVPPQSDSETISIVVQNIFTYGQNSYSQYCQSCHGSQGVGGNEQVIQCIAEADLAFGMTRSPMSGIGNSWQDFDREFNAILYYLQNVQPQNCL